MPQSAGGLGNNAAPQRCLHGHCSGRARSWQAPKSSLISRVSEGTGTKPAVDCSDYFNIHPPQLMSAPSNQTPPPPTSRLQSGQSKGSVVICGQSSSVRARGGQCKPGASWQKSHWHEHLLSPGFVGSLLGGSVFSHRGWTRRNPVEPHADPGCSQAALPAKPRCGFQHLPLKLSRIRALLPNTPCFSSCHHNRALVTVPPVWHSLTGALPLRRRREQGLGRSVLALAALPELGKRLRYHSETLQSQGTSALRGFF